MPTLWKTDFSPPSNAVRVLASILGFEFHYVNVKFAMLEHKSADFMKINPLGTIPLLEDGDFMLSDSHAILKYLLEKYGEDQHKKIMYPSSSKTRAIIDQAMFFDSSVFHVRFKAVVLPTILGDLTGPTSSHLADIEAAYAVVEAYLGNRPFLAADYMTLADISVGMTAASMQTILKLNKARFPRTVKWLDSLNEISSFKKYAEPCCKILSQVLSRAWERNKLKR